jgi:DNA polymerase V
MFCVVYCPDFYIQCERLFRPELRGRGLLITASGDIGDDPIIASSKEARDLGLTPGLAGDPLVALFSQITSEHTVTVCRPNYELYADLSSRLIKSLELLAPKVAASASNEAILALDGLKLGKYNLSENKVPESKACEHKEPEPESAKLNGLGSGSPYHQYAIHLKDTLKQWLGLSVFIGIANTTTLAKLACDVAQTHNQYNGVVDLSSGSEHPMILKRIAVEDIAGISKKVANRLSQINIHSALDLSQAPKNQVRRHSSMITERIAIELSGLPCKTPEQSATGASVITMSKHVDAYSFKQMKRVLDAQVVSAIEQLNNLSNNCNAVTVALTITPLDEQKPAFENSLSSELTKPTDSIAAIRKLAVQLLESVWRDGYQYQSVKLNLAELNTNDGDQIGLFPTVTKYAAVTSNRDSPKSISIETHLSIDAANLSRQNRSLLSRSFTTRWGDIARVS